MEKNKGTKGQLQGKDSSGGFLEVPPENNIYTLAEMGITKNLSSEAQTLAKMDEEKFEKVATGRKRGRRAIRT